MALAAALSAACSGGSGSGAAGGGAGGLGGGASGTGAASGSGGAAGAAGMGGAAGGGASGGTSSSGGSAGTGGAGGAGGSTGSESCGNKQDDDSDGFADCDDKDCFADSTCINADLGTLGMSGFVPCGKAVAFSNADSNAICQKYALGWSPQLQSKCQFATYSGTVSFYCPPKPQTNAVGLRWVVHGSVPTEIVGGKPIMWQTLSGEYAFLNGGGSGTNPLHQFFDIQASNHEEDLVGYDKLGIDASTKGTYTNWFAIWDLTGGQKPMISGGFSVVIDAAELFAAK